jgi:hypothetical protein
MTAIGAGRGCVHTLLVLRVALKQRSVALDWKEIQPLGFENFPRRYYPDRVRGYFSAPHPAEHPCFNYVHWNTAAPILANRRIVF